MDKRFVEMDENFVEMDERFVEMDENFVEVDGRFVEMNRRIMVIGGTYSSFSVDKVLFSPTSPFLSNPLKKVNNPSRLANPRR